MKKEVFIMELGTLFFIFIGMTVVSILGITILLLAKSQLVKNIYFYLLAIWGVVIAINGATLEPENSIIQQIIFWIFGFLVVIGILIKITAKFERAELVADIFVITSVIVGLINLFL